MYDADKPMLIGLTLFIAVLLGLLVTGFFGGSFLPYQPEGVFLKKIQVDGTLLQVEVADTKETRINGLSGRSQIPANQGMLFIFEESGIYSIWMKNMNFPLDVFWINEEGVIVDMWENAHPDSYPQVYQPQSDAYYILETIAGFAEVYNVEIGDQVTGL